MCYDNDGYADIYDSRKVRGRRDRSCVECGQVIPAGALHEHDSWLFDGSWGHTRTCLRCVAVRVWVQHQEADRGCDEYESTPPSGELWTAVHEYYGSDPDHWWFEAHFPDAPEHEKIAWSYVELDQLHIFDPPKQRPRFNLLTPLNA